MYKHASRARSRCSSTAEGLSALLHHLNHLVSQRMLRPELVRELGYLAHIEIDTLLRSPVSRPHDVAGLHDAMARFDKSLLLAQAQLLLEALQREEPEERGTGVAEPDRSSRQPVGAAELPRPVRFARKSMPVSQREV